MSAAASQVVVEERIQGSIKRFDVPALLDALHAAGYRDDQIEFRSHPTTVHQSHLVHAIEFQPAPDRRAIITVNLGLRSLQTPLPSFFLQAMHGAPAGAGDDGTLGEFLACFDHLLLRARFAGIYPERDPAVLPEWDRTAHDRLRLLRLASPQTVHWLFRGLYPELEVTVRRQTARQRIATPLLRLGAATLGDGTAVGGWAAVPVGGLEVRLFADESICPTGQPWAAEAQRRFDQHLRPLLAETQLTLSLLLVLRDQSAFARTVPQSHLGFEPLHGAEDATQQLVLFSGTV